MRNRFRKNGTASGFQFTFGVRTNRTDGQREAFLELDDTFDNEISVDASDGCVEGLSAKVDAALRKLRVACCERHIVQEEIIEGIVAPAVRHRL